MLLLLQEYHVRCDPVPVQGVHIVFRPAFLQRLGNGELQRPLHLAPCDRHGRLQPRRTFLLASVSRYRTNHLSYGIYFGGSLQVQYKIQLILAADLL